MVYHPGQVMPGAGAGAGAGAGCWVPVLGAGARF